MRQWLLDYPDAAKALKHCSDECFPPELTEPQTRLLQQKIEQARKVGPINKRAMNEYLFFRRESLDEAIDALPSRSVRKGEFDVAVQSLRQELLDELFVSGIGLARRSPPEDLSRAVEALKSGGGTKEDIEVLLREAVIVARDFSQVSQVLSGKSLAHSPWWKIMENCCGTGRDVSAAALGILGQGNSWQLSDRALLVQGMARG